MHYKRTLIKLRIGRSSKGYILYRYFFLRIPTHKENIRATKDHSLLAFAYDAHITAQVQREMLFISIVTIGEMNSVRILAISPYPLNSQGNGL